MTKKQRKTSRFLRRLLRTAGILLVLIFTVLLIAPVFLRPLVKRIIYNKIVTGTHQLYQVDFKVTQFSIIPGRIRIEDITLIPDSVRLHEAHPQNYYEVSAKEVEGRGIRFWTYLLNGSWDIRKVSVKDAKVSIHHDARGKHVLPGKKNKAFRLLLRHVAFENTELEIWNEEKKERRFTCTLVSGSICRLRILQDQPVDFIRSQLRFAPVEVQTREGHALHLDNVTITTEHHSVSVYARQVEVNKLADALGDQQHTFFKDRVLTCTVDSLVFSASDYRHWPSLLTGSKQGIRVERVYLYHPLFNYYPGRVIRDNDSLGLNPIADRKSTRFHIGSFEIRDGEFHSWDSTETYRMVDVSNFYITLSALRSSPLTYQMPVIANDIRAGADSVHLSLHKKLYSLSATKLSLKLSGRKLELHNLLLTPAVGTNEFYAIKGFQTDYPVLQVPHAEVLNIAYDQLLSRLTVDADFVGIHEPELHLFRNKNQSLNTVKRPLFPQQQIRSIPIPFYIDSVAIYNGVIRYDELAKDAYDTGHFSMEQVFISTHHITNRPALLEQTDSLQVKFSGKFYGKGLIESTITLYMNDPNGRHTVRGTIGSLQAQLLNAITMPSAHLRIRSGTVHGGEFYFTADYQQSQGWLLLRFDKLKIALLETEKGSEKLKINRLKTFVANVFLVKENPESGKEPVISMISYQRDPSRWVINYWWKSLLSGIDHIVLARKGQMMAIKKDADELKNLRKNRNKKDDE